jgi:hypothetical protein
MVNFFDAVVECNPLDKFRHAVKLPNDRKVIQEINSRYDSHFDNIT